MPGAGAFLARGKSCFSDRNSSDGILVMVDRRNSDGRDLWCWNCFWESDQGDGLGHGGRGYGSHSLDPRVEADKFPPPIPILNPRKTRLLTLEDIVMRGIQTSRGLGRDQG